MVTSIAGEEDFVTVVLEEFHAEAVSLVNCGTTRPW